MLKALVFVSITFVLTLVVSMIVAFIIQMIGAVVQKKQTPAAKSVPDAKGGA